MPPERGFLPPSWTAPSWPGPAAGAKVSSERGIISTSQLKRILREKVYSQLNPAEILARLKIDSDAVRRDLSELVDQIVWDEGYFLSEAAKREMQTYILDEILGLGPLEPLRRDPTITEIMVNGPRNVWIEREGRLYRTDIVFDDGEHVLNVIEKILAPIGRRVDESSPMVNGRLPDGSRVNAIIPPLALDGPSLTIRKFRELYFTLPELVELGTLTEEVARFLEATVRARLNILVSGGAGSGKTTLLNTLSSFIPPDERVVTIEDAAELRLEQPHVVRLEARPPNVEGKGEITIRDLVVNALRMRPDRIVVGEVRAGEALDMLQAMNTGHDGSLTTAHANAPKEVISRLETMVLMSGMELPVKAIRQQIAGGIQLIVHMNRLEDGSRKMMEVSEISGIVGEEVQMQQLFVFEPAGPYGREGRLSYTGAVPTYLPRLKRVNPALAAVLAP